MHLAWDYLHMVADNGNVALLELRERIYNTGSAEIPQDAAPPVLPYQQESVIPQAPPAGKLITPTTPLPYPLPNHNPPHPTSLHPNPNRTPSRVMPNRPESSVSQALLASPLNTPLAE